MQKKFQTLQDYHDTDQSIQFQKFSGDQFRVGYLVEASSDVRFTSTNRNALVVDLSGTNKHLTQMDGTLDETPTRKGDVCLIPPGAEVRFAWDVLGTAQSSITLEFDSEAFSTYLPQFERDRIATGHLIATNYGDRPILRGLAELLGKEINPALRRGKVFADSIMRLVLLEVATSHWSKPLPPVDPPRRADARVQRAIDYIEAHFAEDMSLSDIACASGLSLTQLTGLFQRATGTTPYSYVIDRRLQRATELLETTDMCIARIAVETGFSDQQHLTRAFRARLNRTPQQVRKGAATPHTPLAGRDG